MKSQSLILILLFQSLVPAHAQQGWKNAPVAKKAEFLKNYLVSEIGNENLRGRISAGCALDTGPISGAVDELARLFSRIDPKNKCGAWSEYIIQVTQEKKLGFKLARYQFFDIKAGHAFNVLFVPPGPREKLGRLLRVDGFKNQVEFLEPVSLTQNKSKAIYQIKHFGGFRVGKSGIEKFFVPADGESEVYQFDVETEQPVIAKKVDPATGRIVRYKTGEKLVLPIQKIYGKD